MLSGVYKHALAPLLDSLKKTFPDTRITLRSIDPLQDKDAISFFPDGMLYRVSAVVAHPETKHAALLDFVICGKAADRIVLPLAGDHSEFASLLRRRNKNFRDASDALSAGRAYAAIYRLEISKDPIVLRTKDGYSIKFQLDDYNGKSVGTQRVDLEIKLDSEKRVTDAVQRLNAGDSHETK